jgi:DNA-binding response OmpR family regulator
MRILVVDDYTELLEYLANLLDSAGHEVELAADGREGLLKFREGGSTQLSRTGTCQT